jgi:hypothetical protein
MLLQENLDMLDWSNIFAPMSTIAIYIIFIALMIIVLHFEKIRIFTIVLVIFLFSIVIGILSMSIQELPFNPYLPLFFILFQSILFIKFTIEVYF